MKEYLFKYNNHNNNKKRYFIYRIVINSFVKKGKTHGL